MTNIDLARSEARKKYQLHIDYIKSLVGEGEIIETPLLRLCLTRKGFWYEFKIMPEEFSGCANADGLDGIYEHPDNSQALILINKIIDCLYAVKLSNTRKFQWFIIYGNDPFDISKMSIFDFPYEDTPFPLWSGEVSEDCLPEFMKLRADSDLLLPILGDKRCTLIFTKLPDQNLLIKPPLKIGRDLGKMPTSDLVH